MCIHQHVGVILLPLDEVGKVCPQATALDAVHQLVVVIEFHQAATAGKGTTHFVQHRLVVALVSCWRTELGKDESVGHQCVDGADGRVGNVVLVNQVVAVSDPVLALGGIVANAVVVVLLTPCGI